MAGNPYLWSTTASLNDTIDADINWQEGQLPGTVNNSARGLMAGVAGWLKDTNGSLTSGGSANAHTLTTNVGYAALAQGLRLVFEAGFTNTAAATLTVTPAGGGAFAAKAIRVVVAGGTDSALTAGMIQATGHYEIEYDTGANGAAGAWILLNPNLAVSVALLAPIASPTFTGNPLGPTPAAGDNDTSLATTAYVIGEVTRPNLLLEGQFECWQYGTPVTDANGAAKFGPDRWKVSAFATAGNAYTLSRQSNLGNGTKYKVRVQRDSGDTDTQIRTFYTALDSDDSQKFAGKTITVSFYATAGANYSAASSQLTSRIVTGTGNNQAMDSVPGVAWTGAATSDQVNTISTTRTRFSHTVAIGSSTTQIGLAFLHTPVGTASTNDYFEIDSVKWEIGSCSTLYVPSEKILVVERCLYYSEDLGWEVFSNTQNLRVIAHGFTTNAGGGGGTNQNFLCRVPFRTKRSIAPTITYPTTAATDWHVADSGGARYNIVVDNFDHFSVFDGLLAFHYVIGGAPNIALVLDRPFILAMDGNAGSILRVSCEL